MEIIHDAPIPTNSPRDATGSASVSRVSNAVTDTQKTYDVVGEASLQSFPGLAHRQELIATIDGVRYVNDSKATNADAAAKALACYETVYWIAGGLAKEGGIVSLSAYHDRIRHAFLIGEAAPAFADTLGSQVPHSRSGELAAAVMAAHELAGRERRPGAVVLLSPAAASFDQFANFEARGDEFRRLVGALPKPRLAGA